MEFYIMGKDINVGKKSIVSNIIIPVIILCMLVVVTCVAVFIGFGWKAVRIKNKLACAERYLDDLDYDNAQAAFADVLKIDPSNVEAYLGLIEVCMVQNHMDEALEYAKIGFDLTGDISLKEKIEVIEISLNKVKEKSIEHNEEKKPKEETDEANDVNSDDGDIDDENIDNEDNGKYQHLLETKGAIMAARLNIIEEKEDYYLVKVNLSQYPAVSYDELKACFDSDGRVINNKIVSSDGKELTVFESVLDGNDYEWTSDIDNYVVLGTEEGEYRLVSWDLSESRCDTDFISEGYIETDALYLDIGVDRRLTVPLEANVELKLKKDQSIELFDYARSIDTMLPYDELLIEYTAQEAFNMCFEKVYGNYADYEDYESAPIAFIEFDENGYITRYRENRGNYTE